MIHTGLRGWGDNDSGNVAVLFAILIYPLIFIIGFNLDLSRQISADRQVQTAADAASLAGANALQDASLGHEELKAITIASFEANRAAGFRDTTCKDPDISIDRGKNEVDFVVTCTVPRMFPNPLLGASHSEFTNRSTSVIGLSSLDVALMLDMSVSMNDGSRLADLKTAATTMVTTLITPQSGDRARIALAPYGEAVNAGVYGNRAQGRSDFHDGDNDGDKVCVSRRRNFATQFTDVAPGPSHYVGDRVGDRCDEPMIVPLSGDADHLTSAISAMSANGSKTAGHLGLAWSWYLISPNWRSILPPESAPLEKNAPNTTKVVVMMTDGIFNKHYETDQFWSVFMSPEDTKELCTSMLADGVLIYVVALALEDYSPTANHAWYAEYAPKVLLPYCAGDPSRYFEVNSSEDLVDIYQSIADLLSVEAVVITH